MTYWARTVADGHLRQPDRRALTLRSTTPSSKRSRRANVPIWPRGPFPQIERDEMVAWVHYAKGMDDGALKHMRDAADLQDKVGQAEVDIPAREMLADMLLELHRPQEALAEYEIALKLSPNRFNGLYHAGDAAEAAGKKRRAEFYASAAQIHRQRPELGTCRVSARTGFCIFEADRGEVMWRQTRPAAVVSPPGKATGLKALSRAGRPAVSRFPGQEWRAG